MNKYKDDLSINSNLLEQELENQPILYMEYAELHAAAIKEKEHLKQKIDLLYIELDNKVRADYDKYFSRRPTEKQIQNWVYANPEYVKAQRNYSESCYNVNVLAGAKEAIFQKRAILGNIVSMKIAGIYATPKVKKEDSKVLLRRKTSIRPNRN
jgi:hypothetical protein